MVDDTTASGDDQVSAEHDQSTETESNAPSADDKLVSHQKRLLMETKAAKARARELEARLKSIEDERLSEQGNKDELIKSLKAKLDGETKKSKDLYNSYARKSLGAQMKSAALEAGCIDPDAVMSLGDFSTLEIDANTFEADESEVKDVINGLKKSKPYLFQKPGPKLNSKFPSGAPAGGGRIDANSMSNAEIQALLRTLK